MTKWPVQKQTHRTAQKNAEQQDLTDIQDIKDKLFFVFGDFSLFLNLYLSFNKMISPRNVELPPWYGHKPQQIHLRYRKCTM